jgi:hypothetical protein
MTTTGLEKVFIALFWFAAAVGGPFAVLDAGERDVY